jgi:very-short-patch-repair endonuclease
MEMTISEAALWGGIQRRQTGARFRRQVPIGIWIVDFASFSPKLVIEVDDESHNWRDETQRSHDIRSRGFTILRFDNKEIAQHPDDAVDTVRNWVQWLREGRNPEED